MSIGARLKEERKRLCMAIPAFAAIAGVGKNTFIDWQNDASSPPAAKLAALAEAGLDVLYVVTGQRPQASQPGLDDRNRLIAAVEAVEEGLAEVRRKLPPKKRAELIIAAYDLITEPEQSRANVVNLVRIAA